jgi:hypothetical protein
MNSYISAVDESRRLLRELQVMLFDDTDSKDLFSKTLEINSLLDEASKEFNKYVNEKNVIIEKKNN